MLLVGALVSSDGFPGVGGVGGDPSGEWPKKEGREGGCPGRKPQSFKAESQQ